MEKPDFDGWHLAVIMNLKGRGLPSDCVALYHKGSEVRSVTGEDCLSWASQLISDGLRYDKRPWVLINCDTPVFANVKVNDEDRVRIMELGLAVYMYEPLYIRSFEGAFAQVNFGNPPDKIDEETLSHTGCIELDSINSFLRFNQFHPKVSVYLCEKGLETLLGKFPQYRSFKFYNLDTFLFHEAILRRNAKIKIQKQDQFNKTFACFNYRYEAFREMVVAYIRARGYHSQSLISYYHQHDSTAFAGRCHTRMNEMSHWDDVLRGIELMRNEVPYYFDSKNPIAVNPSKYPIPWMLDGANRKDRDEETPYFYQSCFVALANETRFFHNCGIITEKTLVPIVSGRPFVLIGSAYLLRYLHELGFKSFGDHWNESYDSIEDPARRLDAIFKIIDEIASYDHKKLQEMLRSMSPILDYNKKHLLEGFYEMQIKRISNPDSSH